MGVRKLRIVEVIESYVAHADIFDKIINPKFDRRSQERHVALERVRYLVRTALPPPKRPCIP